MNTTFKVQLRHERKLKKDLKDYDEMYSSLFTLPYIIF